MKENKMHSEQVGGMVLIVSIILYMLPALIALSRDHHNKTAIIVLDVIAGWTGIGWLVALIWSLTVVKERI